MNTEDEWETDDEKTEYLRLSIEKSKKIKNTLNTAKLFHTKIIKRLEAKEIESAKTLHNFINNTIVKQAKVLIDKALNKPYLSIEDNDFVLENNPEIGTNIIIEQTDKSNMKVLGVAERYLEATVFKPKKRITTTTRKKPPPIVTQINNPQSVNLTNKQAQPSETTSCIGKKRRRPKRTYKKDSTVIEIRKRDS